MLVPRACGWHPELPRFNGSRACWADQGAHLCRLHGIVAGEAKVDVTSLSRPCLGWSASSSVAILVCIHHTVRVVVSPVESTGRLWD